MKPVALFAFVAHYRLVRSDAGALATAINYSNSRRLTKTGPHPTNSGISICREAAKVVNQMDELPILKQNAGQSNDPAIKHMAKSVSKGCAALEKAGNPQMRQCTFYANAIAQYPETAESNVLKFWSNQANMEHACATIVAKVNKESKDDHGAAKRRLSGQDQQELLGMHAEVVEAEANGIELLYDDNWDVSPIDDFLRAANATPVRRLAEDDGKPWSNFAIAQEERGIDVWVTKEYKRRLAGAVVPKNSPEIHAFVCKSFHPITGQELTREDLFNPEIMKDLDSSYYAATKIAWNNLQRRRLAAKGSARMVPDDAPTFKEE